MLPVWPLYWFSSAEGYRAVQHAVSGVHLNVGRAAKIPFPLPPMPAQRRIAALLDEYMANVGRARAAAEAQVEAARALPAAYLREVFEGEEARGWPRTRLGDLAVLVQNGIYKTAESYGRGLPLVRMYNLQSHTWHLDLSHEARVAASNDEARRYELAAGDLLVSRVNSFELVGKCACAGSDVSGHVFENMVIRIRLSDAADPVFVAQQMGTKGIKQQIQGVAKRAIGQASINAADLRGLWLTLPPREVQERVAALIDEQMAAVARARGAADEQSALAQALPPALLRRAFRGEL
ncbi:MAG: hypothetical protein ACE149_11625 [Armatimonadota bacterium]